MKTYIEFEKYIYINGLSIPKDPQNIDYVAFLEDQKNGEAELVPYIPPAITWEFIRSQRNELLKQTDWIGVSDAQPKPSKQAWLDYRQQLRDITKNFTDPNKVIWPTKPK